MAMLLEDFYTAPPSVAAVPLSARVPGIWRDDAILLDGDARQGIHPREYITTDSACHTSETTVAEFHGIHVWPYKLFYKIASWRDSGSGTVTFKLYYQWILVATLTLNTGGITWEDSADISGITYPDSPMLPYCRITQTGPAGTNAHLEIYYIEERPNVAALTPTYTPPAAMIDATVPSLANFNSIPGAIATLYAACAGGRPGMVWIDHKVVWYPGNWGEWITVQTWQMFLHGDTLHYNVRIKKFPGQKCMFRFYVGGNLVTTDADCTWGKGEGSGNADHSDPNWDGKVFDSSVAITGTENTLTTLRFDRYWEGYQEGVEAWWTLDHLYTSKTGAIAVPNKFTALTPVYGNTAGAGKARLNDITTLLRAMAGDTGGTAYNSDGNAYLFPRSPLIPIPQECGRMVNLHTGRSVLVYRAKDATLHWGANQTQRLEDWITGRSPRCRTLNLRDLNGMLPGMVYYITSSSNQVKFIGEVMA